MAFTNVWDVTYPPDSQLANLLGQDLRNLRLDIQQRMGAISGLDAAKPALGGDTQPGNWNGVLFFATDTGKVYQWNNPVWTDVSQNLFNSVIPVLENTAQTHGSLQFSGPFINGSSSIEASNQVAMPMAGLIKNLYITSSTAQGTGGNCVFTFRKNGVSQAVSVTVVAGSAAGVFSDTVNSFSFAAGDKITLMASQGSTAGSVLVVNAAVAELCTP